MCLLDWGILLVAPIFVARFIFVGSLFGIPFVSEIPDSAGKNVVLHPRMVVEKRRIADNGAVCPVASLCFGRIVVVGDSLLALSGIGVLVCVFISRRSDFSKAGREFFDAFCLSLGIGCVFFGISEAERIL